MRVGAWREPRTAIAFILLAVAALAICRPATAEADIRPSDRIGEIAVADASPAVAEAAPDVSAPAAFLITSTGRVLWSRSAEEGRQIASLTKMMTGLLVLETASLDETVVVSSRAAAIGGSGIAFQRGEILTVEDLLHALLMESSNAAALALAEHASGTEKEFVAAMNSRAASLGLRGTTFKNPHGLNNTGHVSTARDQAVIALAAMGDPVFRDIVGATSVRIPGPWGERVLENSNTLIGTYPGATGVKTGWTNPAGYCVVASAQRDGSELVAVVLGTRSEKARFEVAKELLDWGFAHFGPEKLASAGETVTVVPVSDYVDRYVALKVGEDLVAPVFDLEGDLRSEYEVVSEVRAPIEIGDELGVVRVYQDDLVLGEVPVVAAESVAAPGWLERIQIWFQRLWLSWFEGDEPASAGA